MPSHIMSDMRVPKQFIYSRSDFQGHEDGPFLRGDLQIDGGRVVGMGPSLAPTDGRIMLPKLVEPHCHLDKCHTIDRLAHVGGDLHAAIDAQRIDKVNWTDADIRTRTQRGLDEYATSGTGLIRSHVDWGEDPTPPRAWSILQELAQEDHNPTLQLSALTSLYQVVDPSFADAVAQTIPQGHALGVFVYNQPDMDRGLRNIFQTAITRGLPLDFHVDEGLDLGLNGLERIADIALETGFDGPILCGHACNLPLRDLTAQQRIIDKLAKAGITIAMLPTTNLYLQGRANGTPTMRGLTAAHELTQSGVPVVIGCDNVRDAFCPVGRHDPMHALELAVLGAHLDPPFERWLATITTHASLALGHAAPTIDRTLLSDLLIANACDLSTLISGVSLRPASLSTKT